MFSKDYIRLLLRPSVDSETLVLALTKVDPKKWQPRFDKLMEIEGWDPVFAHWFHEAEDVLESMLDN